MQIKHHLTLAAGLLMAFSAHAGIGKDMKGALDVHDPVMIKDGSTYYVFATGRGVSMKTSKDGVTWEAARGVFNRDNMPA